MTVFDNDGRHSAAGKALIVMVCDGATATHLYAWAIFRVRQRLSMP